MVKLIRFVQLPAIKPQLGPAAPEYFVTYLMVTAEVRLPDYVNVIV